MNMLTLGKGRSIHAAGQMEWFNSQVDDRSKIVGGAQRIETSEGYVIPLSIESGLVYMHSIRIPTFRIIPMSSLHLLIFGMPQFWTMRLHHLSLRPSTNTLMTHCSKTPSLMNMETFITELSKS